MQPRHNPCRPVMRHAIGVLALAVLLPAEWLLAGTDGDGGCHRGFQTVDPVASISEPQSVVWGDFDGDGRLDLAATWMDSRTTVMLNRGNEVFEPQPYAVAPNYDAAKIVAVTDIDGDGHLDLVYRFGSQIWTRFGDGKGGFGGFMASPPLPAEVTQWRVADVTGDGIIDFVDASASAVRIIEGHRDGTFTVAASIPVKLWDWQLGLLAVGDFDGDGRIDIAGAGKPSQGQPRVMYVLWNEGNLQFSQTSWSPPGPLGEHLTALDVDGDGRAELVVPAAGWLAVMSLRQRQIAVDLTQIDALPELLAVQVADIDGDGTPDLVLVRRSTVGVAWGIAPGQFSAPSYFAVPDENLSVTVADIDGDGIPDVAGGLFVLQGKRGTRQLDAPTLVPLGFTGWWTGALAGDVTGNGTMDIVAYDYPSGDLRVLLDDGSGGFRLLPVQKAFGEPLVLADLDGDGKADIVMAADGGKPLILYGDGAGGFGAAGGVAQAGTPAGAVRLASGMGNAIVAYKGQDLQLVRIARDRSVSVSTIQHFAFDPKVLSVVDLDGDGASDLVVRGPGGAFQVVMQSGGGWSSGATIPWGFFAYDSVVAGDLDGDGRPDIVAWGDDGCDVLLQNPDGTFTRGARIPYSGFVAGVRLADVDGDGRLDVITTSGSSGHPYQVLVAQNVGGGSFRPYAGTWTAFDGFGIVRLDGLGGDRRPDLVLATPDGIEIMCNICRAPRLRAAAVPAAPLPGQSANLLVHLLGGSAALSILENGLLVQPQWMGYATMSLTTLPLPAGGSRFQMTCEDPYEGESELSFDLRTAVPARRWLRPR